jgi:membrane protein DedA with SNARE-associated domain
VHSELFHALHRYGYGLVAVLVFAECVGLPLPGESALLAAAAMAGRHELSIFSVVAAAAVGAILGGTAGYWIGYRGGLPLLHRYGGKIGLDESKVQRAQAFYEKHGTKAVFFARFVAIVRILAAMLAGVARMEFKAFAVYNALGAICWAIVIAAAGYFFGERLPQFERLVGHAGWVVIALAVLPLIAWTLWKRRRRAVPARGGGQ